MARNGSQAAYGRVRYVPSNRRPSKTGGACLGSDVGVSDRLKLA